jgi:hypothetical protein
MNNTVIPQISTAKYLGFHLDSRLIWKQHIAKKKKRKKERKKKKKTDKSKSKRYLLEPVDEDLLHC